MSKIGTVRWINISGLKERALAEKLIAAAAITSAISLMHDSGVVSCKLSFQSFYVDAATLNRCKITGFDYNERKKSGPLPDGRIHAAISMPYTSPEILIGGIETADKRSDLYSLGVVLYELFTGRLPFSPDSPEDLKLCHLAVIPVEPDVINPGVPRTISGIIMKLLSKDPDERYNIAEEVRKEIELLIDITSEPVLLHNKEIYSAINISGKLYGRNRELFVCRDAWKRAGEGGIELIVVSGESGVGKTALVNKLFEKSVAYGSICGYGKFNEGAGDIPYSAVSAAFTSMIRRILSDSDVELESLQRRFIEALEPNIAIINSIIPEFEQIAGKHPDLPPAGPVEAKNRLFIWFSRFAGVLAEYSAPAVLFLDDLQWADSASLELVKYLVMESEIKKLVVICAYREGEDYETGFHMEFVKSVRSAGGMTFIHIGGLDKKSVADMINGMIDPSGSIHNEIAELVYRKTAGIPLYVIEFLKEAFARNALEHSKGIFNWYSEKLESMPAAEGLANILSSSMKRLSAGMQRTLAAGACAGWSFSVELIAAVLMMREDEAESLLYSLCEKGFIVKERDYYRFVHDRVRETAYSLIPEADRLKLHRRTGRILYGMSENDDTLFHAVEQMNLGKVLIDNKREIIELAQLNLSAGLKSKTGAAYSSALLYLQAAYDLLPPDSWINEYNLTYSVCRELAEVLYIEGNYDESEKLINSALAKVKSDFERAEFHLIRIQKYYIMARNIDGVEEGKKALKLFSIDIPEIDLDKCLKDEIGKIDSFIEKNGLDSLISLPETEDPIEILIHKILNKVAVTAFFSSFYMLQYACIKAVTLSIEKGISSQSIAAFSGYGNVCLILEDYKRGYEFIKIAVKMCEQFNDNAVRCAVYNHMANQGMVWFRHLKDTEEINRKGLEYGIISGELIYAGMITSHMMANAFHSGVMLDEILLKIGEHILFNKRTGNVLSLDILLGLERVLLNLTGNTSNNRSFDTEELPEILFINACLQHRNEIMIQQYYVFKLQVLYLYKFYKEAYHLCESFEKNVGALKVVYSYAEYIFYNSLILAALIPSADDDTKVAYMEKIKSNQQKMKVWSEMCKENFLHKYYLVEAEISAFGFDTSYTINFYIKSMESAAENGYIQNEALANELIGMFLMRRGKRDFAMLHLEHAYEKYKKWGALRKAALLEDEFELYSTGKDSDKALPDNKSSNTSGNTALIKSLQAISGEIEFGSLMHTLMRNMLQYEGGTRILLFIEKKARLYLEAEGFVDQKSGSINTLVHDSVYIDDCIDVPSRLIRYCSRSREDLLINDVASGKIPVPSEYLESGRAKSVLCIRNISRTTAVVVYIENSLAKNTFTPQSIEVLKLLAAQAAISIENSRLYSEMEENAARLSEMAESGEKLLRQYDEARHKAMADRANPHFLYNAIHTIHALIRIDPVEAEKAILMLADIMRFLTDRSFEKLITLEDEMKFVELYLSFEKIRFPDTVTFSISTDGSLNSVAVPPLIVQPLVENAIKHGLRKKPGGGRIDISLSVNSGSVNIKVADTGAGVQNKDIFSRTLGNIRVRLRYFYPDAELTLADMENGGAIASISFTITGDEYEK